MVTRIVMTAYGVIAALAIIFFSITHNKLHAENYIISKDKWECGIEHTKSGDCVVYTINKNEIQKYISPRHREHNVPERQPLLNAQ